MPSNKFNQRPVPRRRPAICIAPAGSCLPKYETLIPIRLTIAFGWVDLDPALPPEEQPQIFAFGTSDPRTGDPPSWHIAHTQPPWELHCWVELEPTPGRCLVTLRLWYLEEHEDWVFPTVTFNPWKPFDTRPLTHTHIPFKDYRWVHAQA